MGENEVKSLFLRLKGGDRSVFSEFYDLTKNQVFNNIVALTKNYEISEDILQDTYVLFLKKLQSIEDTNILGFLMVTSRNLTIDYFKKYSKVVNLDDSSIEIACNDKREIDNKLLLAKIEKILKDKEFEIFVMHVMSDLTFEEIARIKKRPLGSVLRSYNNAIKKIQKEVKYEKD